MTAKNTPPAARMPGRSAGRNGTRAPTIGTPATSFSVTAAASTVMAYWLALKRTLIGDLPVIRSQMIDVTAISGIAAKPDVSTSAKVNVVEGVTSPSAPGAARAAGTSRRSGPLAANSIGHDAEVARRSCARSVQPKMSTMAVPDVQTAPMNAYARTTLGRQS